jgi:NADPH:quinone reductase-like Zn-dependent oxidoreductase
MTSNLASVGLYAIQLAHIHSIPVITVCSPKHFDLCKSLGATHVFDYRGANVVQSIQAAAPNIEYVFDCIGNESSSKLSSQTVPPEGGVLCTVRPGKVFTEDVEKRVKVTDVLVWTAFLKEHRYKEFKWPVSFHYMNDLYAVY